MTTYHMNMCVKQSFTPIPMWKGPWLYHENAWIICVFLPMISVDTVKIFYTAALCDMLRKFTGVQFTVINS